MTTFWQRWLTIWCIGVGAFGLLLYSAGFPATTTAAAAIFSAFGNPLPSEPDRYLRFTTSLMGAVTTGWAITYYAAFRAAWTQTGAASVATWRMLTLGTFAWYLIDSTASYANGFTLNAVSNSVLLVAYLIPVLATRLLSHTDKPDALNDANKGRRTI